jgi:hypothetical protein
MLDPETVFGRYADLTPLNGHRHGLVLCPFHQEKTKSLSVDLDRGVWHCFGCGSGGGLKAFLKAAGEDVPEFTSPPREQDPSSVVRRLALAQPWARAGVLAAYSQADEFRHRLRQAHELRRFATFASDLDDADRWQILADAAWFETEAHRLDT